MNTLFLLALVPLAQDHMHETFADYPSESPETERYHEHESGDDHGAHLHGARGLVELGAVIDLIADHTDVDGSRDDGFDLRLRSLEMSVHSQIDDHTYGYALLVADEDDVVLEEALVQYTGLPGETSLRAGRFFADFGTQMQLHVHELPYPERPAVLREYLGRELAGTGVQIDHWLGSDDANAYRLSLGVFDSLLAEHGHGEEESEEVGGEPFSPDRSDLGDLSFTARVAGIHHVGASGLFEWGLSTRSIPDLGFELDSSGFEVDGLSNQVIGADLTYRNHSAAGAGWTFGGEALWFDGDIGAEVDDEGTPATTP